MKGHPLLISILAVFLVSGFLAGLFFFVLSLGRSDGRSFLPFGSGSVAVVKIEGPIFDSLETLRELHRYAENSSIKAVVLRIDSPGGAVAPSQEIFEEVRKLKKEKKVVASMGTVAASGAYYIASAADHVLASPGSVTGSIGVIMESFGLQELLKLARMENRVIKSGDLKDVGNPFRPVTEKETLYLQSLIDNLYGQFKRAVGTERKIPPEKMDALADGRIFTGEQALEAGLIDGFGNLYDALDQAKKLSGLSPDARVIWPKEEFSPFDFVSSSVKSIFGITNFFKQSMGSFEVPVWLYRLPSSRMP